MHMQDKRVVIIGGTSGIGLATADLFAQEGAKVTIASRSKEKVQSAQGHLGTNVSGYALDFRDDSQLAKLFEKIGRFDHLVITAGEGTMGAFSDIPIEQASSAFDSKFWGQYRAVKAAIGYVARSGSITLTSGVYGSRPPKGASTLAAINCAIEGLARGLAAELAPIRVNVVSPGLVDTPIYGGMGAKARQQLFESVAEALPVDHVAKPEEIAEAYVYLANNKFTTGSIIDINGGALLG